jgi:hypothetical protein
LRWLEYLCWYSDLGQDYAENLVEGYVMAYHEMVYDKVGRLAEWFFKENRGYQTRVILKQNLNFDDYDLDTLERQGVIVSEDVTSPINSKRYILSPLLGFLKLKE